MRIEGASHEQTPTSVAKVSYWHIPNGADYHNARACMAYFDDADAAAKFAQRYANPPEMALLIPIPDSQPALSKMTST